MSTSTGAPGKDKQTVRSLSDTWNSARRWHSDAKSEWLMVKDLGQALPVHASHPSMVSPDCGELHSPSSQSNRMARLGHASLVTHMGGEEKRPSLSSGPQRKRRAETNSAISMVVLLTTSHMYRAADPHSWSLISFALDSRRKFHWITVLRQRLTGSEIIPFKQLTGVHKMPTGQVSKQ